MGFWRWPMFALAALHGAASLAHALDGDWWDAVGSAAMCLLVLALAGAVLEVEWIEDR